jgi:CelD/BcsL family acetyltransferase involved in cellulose biosynthesis
MLAGGTTAAVPQQRTGTWRVTVSRGGFAGLGEDWDDLFGRARAATPFQAYAWVRSWWDAYGVPGSLRLFLVRLDGRLVAAAPLMLRRRGGCPVLTPLGTPFSDFTDVLLDDALAAEAAARLVEALCAEPGWQALHFPEVRPGGSAGTQLAGDWPGRSWRVSASLCLELPATTMEELVRELPSHSRKTVRRRLNQLDRSGLEVGEVAPADAARAVGDLLRLHAAQWQGRGVNPAHLTAEFRAFLTGAIGGMIATGGAVLHEYRLDGQLMASSLVLLSPELAGGYLFGADPALRERVDVTTMLLADTLPLAHRRGCATMSMLRGAEEHKRRWRPAESANSALLLARPGSARGTAYGMGVAALRRAKRAVLRKAPWLRQVRDRLQAHR